MDYFQILHLKREPFSNSPEPDFFFQSDHHQACLQKLELALRLRRGLNVVMGEVGTGKTTLCRQLIRDLSRREEDRNELETHLILDPSFSTSREFLTMVTHLLGVERNEVERSEWQLKEDIKNYLFHRGVDEGKIVVLIIDEGQKLPDFCLEILREFLNYETNEHKLLQIVIFAQSEFGELVRKQHNVADRVNQYYLLKPLNFRNTVKMIGFRIRQAAADPAIPPSLFSAPALWSIYRTTRGYPRRIITLCHQVLLASIIQNRAKVRLALVRSCARREPVAQAAGWPRWVFPLTIVGFILLLLFMNSGQTGVSPTVKTKPAAATAPLPQHREAPPSAASLSGTEASRPDEGSAPRHKRPDMLGQLVVKENDYLIKILERIYGKDGIRQLASVTLANPHIANQNRLKKGDVIRIPAREAAPEPPLRDTYRVQIAAASNLEDAYRILTELPDAPGLSLVASWNEEAGAVFAVVLEEGFATEAAARSALASLPAVLAVAARVARGWDRGTVFL